MHKKLRLFLSCLLKKKSVPYLTCKAFKRFTLSNGNYVGMSEGAKECYVLSFKELFLYWNLARITKPLKIWQTVFSVSVLFFFFESKIRLEPSRYYLNNLINWDLRFQNLFEFY